MSDMDWELLLSCERLDEGESSQSNAAGAVDARGPFLRDLDRIIYSSAFRRLQGKTQVYAFPETDYVRTRLTHSLEVSSVGRSLGLSVGARLVQRGVGLPQGFSAADFGDLIAAACLAHDIGHPPFGHAGEEAIRNWFRFDRPELLDDSLSASERQDLEGFEANAQGFRLLARLQFWRQRGGMRLCLATLGALSKYPWGSFGINAPGGEPRPRQKFGYYQQDRETFSRVAERLGLARNPAGEGYRRHPLAFLVEAADDICYLIVDIEDGFKSRRLHFEEAAELLRPIAGRNLGGEDLAAADDRLAYLRAKAIGVLVGETVEAFFAQEKEIMAGELETPLLERVASSAYVSKMRETCHERLYDDEHKQRIEIGAFAVIRGLLEVYGDTLLAWEKAGHDASGMPYFHQRALRLLPPEALAAGRRYDGLLAVTDYVAGMTNRFAVSQYRMLRGLGPGADLPERPEWRSEEGF